MLMKNKLISDLKKNIPASNVLDTLEERYAYAQDASNLITIKNLPDAVVFVENAEQVQAVVKLANKYQVPIICRGAGTNVVGACTVEHGGIILNFSKMNKIINISPENMTVTVEPGVVLGHLQKEVENSGKFPKEFFDIWLKLFEDSLNSIFNEEMKAVILQRANMIATNFKRVLYA